MQSALVWEKQRLEIELDMGLAKGKGAEKLGS